MQGPCRGMGLPGNLGDRRQPLEKGEALNRKANTMGDIYSNFFILSSTSFKDRKLIDRDNPVESLLIQYGLPQDVAKYPHPKVKGFRAPIRSTQDKIYKDLLNWIQNELYRWQSDYGVKYTIPVMQRARKKR